MLTVLLPENDRSPALRDLLAQTLADMEADGTTERIAASFGLGADTALGRTTP